MELSHPLGTQHFEGTLLPLKRLGKHCPPMARTCHLLQQLEFDPPLEGSPQQGTTPRHPWTVSEDALGRWCPSIRAPYACNQDHWRESLQISLNSTYKTALSCLRKSEAKLLRCVKWLEREATLNVWFYLGSMLVTILSVTSAPLPSASFSEPDTPPYYRHKLLKLG